MEILDENVLENDGRGPWYCYIVRNTQPKYSGLSYVGSTNDPKRRLRQHNEEICGGARFTHGRGGGWEFFALVTGFLNHKNALSCEWRIKKPSGIPRSQKQSKYRGIPGRILGLEDVLKLDRWTGQCTISNKDCQYTVYLAEDVIKFLNKTELPENITIFSGIPQEFVSTKNSLETS
jgi:predicted GIY-YIG superfamily endonuclease